MKERMLAMVGLAAFLSEPSGSRGSRAMATLFAIALALPVSAQVTYTYTGNSAVPYSATSNNNFSCSSTGVGECGIKGTFTLATALVPNLAESSITPLTFSFTDGVHSWTQSTSTIGAFLVGTDATGVINSWGIVGYFGPQCLMFPYTCTSFGTGNGPSGSGDESMVDLNSVITGALTVNAPGTWTVSGTPPTSLTLDNFKSGSHLVSLSSASSQDTHFGALPPGSPVGAARETDFALGAIPYGQKSTLDVARGICIVDAGFGDIPALLIGYGYTLTGSSAPLGLNLGSYTGFQLNFAGVASSEDLLVVITVWLHTGVAYDFEVVLSPTGNAFNQQFPFSGFSKPGGLTPSNVSDIDLITIQAQGGGFASFGITSFLAYE